MNLHTVVVLSLAANTWLCDSAVAAFQSASPGFRPTCDDDARTISLRFLKTTDSSNACCCPRSSAWPLTQRHGLVLAAGGGGDGSSSSDNKPKTLGRKDGVYVRPSAAIERGSGFFVPGLEGPKVRVAGGVVLLVFTAVNHVLSSSLSNAGNTFQEALAVVFSVLVLLQAGIEYTKEGRRGLILEGSSSESPAAATTGTTSYQQQWSVPTSDDSWKDRVEWAAQAYLSMTSATHICLIGPGGSLVYWLGVRAPPPSREEERIAAISDGARAALTACLQSTSGRVALPPAHPAVTLLAPSDHSRCVVLQRVDEKSQLCWMVTSDQLLASFTKRDLQWLGQLALYIQIPLLE